MSLRVGIIGAGIMGADHALTLHRSIAGATVEVLADVDPARAKAAADAAGGARTLDDANALIDDDAVDAVIIASHDSTHAALATACVRAGKPVLCEKPLAPTLSECRQVVDAEQSAIGSGNPLISLGFMRRFDPGYVAMKAAITAGDIGRTVLVHSVGRGVSSGPGTTSESSVTNSAIHDLDIVPWLLDSPVTEVSWHGTRSTSLADGFADPQFILLRTADGVLSTVEVLLNARYGYDIRCEVVGETGTLELNEPARLRRSAGLVNGTGYAADWRPRFADAYRLELQAWVNGIRSGGAADTTAMATARDGLQAGAVADAVITSMHEGGRVVSVTTA